MCKYVFRWCLVLILFSPVMSCATRSTGPEAGGSAPSTTSEEGTKAYLSGPVLGHLQFHEHLVTISAHIGEPRFVVALADGSAPSEMMSATELRNRYPELWQSYETAFATLDARVEPTVYEASDGRLYPDSFLPSSRIIP